MIRLKNAEELDQDDATEAVDEEPGGFGWVGV